MTTDLLATYPEILALNGATRRPDPVRARVTANSQYELAEPVWRPDTVPQDRRGIHLIPDTRSPRSRGPHPGDVVYWVTCLGGVCLLLLAGIR